MKVKTPRNLWICTPVFQVLSCLIALSPPWFSYLFQRRTNQGSSDWLRVTDHFPLVRFSIVLLVIIQGKWISTLERTLHSYIYVNIFQGSQEMESSQVFLNGWTKKENVIYIHHGTPFSLLKEQIPVICSNMDEPEGYRISTERHTSHDLTHRQNWQINSEIETRRVATQGNMEGRAKKNEERLSKGYSLVEGMVLELSA